MKNPTILKDELSLLRSDKSAVLTELRNKGKELNDIQNEIFKLETRREDVRSEMLEETARLDDLRGRAVSVKSELMVKTQDLKNIQNAYDVSRIKSTQEHKLHLGRIRELEDQERGTINEVSRLRNLFDNNSKVYNNQESERLSKIKSLESGIKEKEKEHKTVSDLVEKKKDEEKKMTKDRLRREDKLRTREKHLDSLEYSLGKREEDLITMSKDMTIVYGRIKEIYSQLHPDLDVDKLIFQAI